MLATLKWELPSIYFRVQVIVAAAFPPGFPEPSSQLSCFISCTLAPSKYWHFFLRRPLENWSMLNIYDKVKSCFFRPAGRFRAGLARRSRRRSARPTGNRPGTRLPPVLPLSSPRGPRGALPKSKKSSQFRG